VLSGLPSADSPTVLATAAAPSASVVEPESSAEAGTGENPVEVEDWPEEPGFEPDATSTGRARGADETMVRPDRTDAAENAGGGNGGNGGADTSSRKAGGAGNDHERAGRARKPLVAAAVLVLVGGAVWALLASQNPSAAANDDAAGHHVAPAPSGDAAPVHSSARAQPSASATHAHSASPSSSAATKTEPAEAPSHVATSASAASATSAPLLSLPGSYNRIRNAQSGECLANPSGTSSAAQSQCASSPTQDWQYSVPLTGLLTAPVSGEFELVDQQSGDCLTAGSGGQVGVHSCSGDSSQLWTKAASSGAGTEYRNVAEAQCLRAGGSAVEDGACSTSDQADLWNEDGTG
jgi:hypothetical protein